MAQTGTFQSKSNKIYFVYQHSLPFYDVREKEFENLQFVQGVNFEFTNSIKNNGTDYLLFVDDSCEKICNSTEFANTATAGRHRGLNTFYTRHNLFPQSKLARDVQLENTDFVLFKSSRDVMQVSTISAQLVIGLELNDCYRDTTSVPYSLFLNDLSSRTDNRLHYCLNTGSIPSKFYIPDRLKQSKNEDDEHRDSLLLSKCSHCFPTNAEVFSFSLVQKNLSGSCESVW